MPVGRRNGGFAGPYDIVSNLAGANLCPTSDFRDYGARCQALGNNRSFLLSAPTPPPFWASYDLNPRHRTVPNTSANTITCTSAYQPNPPQLGKAAVTAGIRRPFGGPDVVR